VYLACWQAAAAAAAALVSQYSTKAVPLGCWLALFITSLHSTLVFTLWDPAAYIVIENDTLCQREAEHWQCAKLKQLYLQLHHSRNAKGHNACCSQ